MPKKKKQIFNGFYMFMKELEPTLRRQGRIQNGMADVVPIAHPQWQAMPSEEKAKYDKMAKECKAQMRGAEADKYRYDNVGNIIADRKDPREEAKKRIKKERDEVVTSWESKDLTKENFYFINFQVLCRTEEGEYLPCEIAAIEYNMVKGITKELHRFVEPGRIPVGYRYTCISQSDETHLIPPEFPLADGNYRGLWIQLENFLNPEGEKPDYPPLYCISDQYEKTTACLEWIHDRTCLGTPTQIKKVYDLSSLVADLYAHAGNKCLSLTMITEMLTSSNWDYITGTRCEWHESQECNFCSLAIVRRYAYAISDALAPVYNFKLTEKHLPCSSDKGPGYIALPPSMLATAPLPTRTSSRGRGWTTPANPGVGRGSTRTPKTENRFPEEEDEDDDETEDYQTRIRRPNKPVPDAWAAQPVASAWASQPLNQSNNFSPGDASQWPSLGGPVDKKYAGRESAPPPGIAPAPPLAWQKLSAPPGLGRGRGRGITVDSLEGKSLAGAVMTGNLRPQAPLGRGLAVNDASSFPAMPVPKMPSTGLLGQGRGVRMRGSGVTRPAIGRGYPQPDIMQQGVNSLHINDAQQ